MEMSVQDLDQRLAYHKRSEILSFALFFLLVLPIIWPSQDLRSMSKYFFHVIALQVFEDQNP